VGLVQGLHGVGTQHDGVRVRILGHPLQFELSAHRRVAVGERLLNEQLAGLRAIDEQAMDQVVHGSRHSRK
jgi:hypothetical protein